MPPAPKLAVIDGGLAETDPPAIPPAGAADRLYLPAHPSGIGDFAHVVAVTLVIHAAILAGALAWNTIGEERSSGGMEELLVIEGVNVVMFDQMPSIPAPLVEAAAIESADDAAPLEETKVAPVETATASLTADNATKSPIAPPQAAAPEATKAVEASDDARRPVDQTVEMTTDEAAVASAETARPVAPVEATSPILERPNESKPIVKAQPVEAAEAEAAEVSEPAAAGAAAPVEAKSLEGELVSSDKLAQSLATTPVDDARAVAATELPAKKDAETAASAPEEAVRPVEDPVQTSESASTVLPAPAAKAAQSETAVAAAPEETVKPVEETREVVAATVPEPAKTAEPLPPKAEPSKTKPEVEEPKAQKPKPSPPKTAAKKKDTASQAKPSVAASEATPSAAGPTKGKAGAGGKNAKAAGKANISSYRAKVLAHLRRYQSYPAAAASRGITGRAVVRISIGGGGRVAGVTVVSSSGSPILDREAMAIARRASPYPAPPPGMSSSVTIQAPLRFGTR